MSKTRNPVPDLLKGLAVLFMIQVHIMELFARQEIMDGSLGKISLFLGGPFAAPVFMAVMGYYIAVSKKSFKQNLFRGIKLVGLGFLLNIGLNLHLLIKIWNGSIDLDPLPYIFGVDILFLAGLSIIILAILNLIFKGHFWMYLVFAVLIILPLPFLTDAAGSTFMVYVKSFLWGRQWWAYFPLIPWLGYPLAGYAFRLIEKQFFEGNIRHFKKQTITLFITSIVVVAASWKAFEITVNLEHYYHHDLFYFIWCCLFLLLWIALVDFTERSLSGQKTMKYIKWLGQHVTVVYIVKWLIIGNIATAIYKTQGMLMIFIWFFFILLLTSLITLIYTNLINKRTPSLTEG